MRTLIAYFSRGGATKKAAERLQKVTNGGIFEITTDKNYGNYFTALGVSRKEFSAQELPKVLTKIKNFDSYDRILLGFPIWFGKAPQVVMSFISQYDFAGKDVYPFCTSGASGISSAVEPIKEACKGATVHEGLRMNKANEEIVWQWLKN